MVTPATFVILGITAIVTLIAFQKSYWRERLIFNPEAILRDKQFERMLTCGLIHLDWMHFAFNAFSFYSFAQMIEWNYGWTTLLLIYLSSILGGSALCLFIHRHHEYRALGASGGVCGVIFASIFLLPGTAIMMFPLPIGIPAYAYAIIFLVGSFIAHRSQRDNIGHDAHLGGAIVGLLVATTLQPALVLASPKLYATVLGLSLLILAVLIFDPLQLWGKGPLRIWKKRFGANNQPQGPERFRHYEENRARNEKISEIDRLLEKVSAKGIQSLSDSERKTLEQLSKEIGRPR